LSFNTRTESAAAAALLDQVHGLSPDDQANFIAQLLADYLEVDGLGRTIAALDELVAVLPAGPGIDALMKLQLRWEETEGDKNSYGFATWGYAVSNPGLSDDFINLIVERRPSVLVPGSTYARTIAAKLTPAQFLRVVETEGASEGVAKAILDRFKDVVTPQAVWTFAQKWAENPKHSAPVSFHANAMNDAIDNVLRMAIADRQTPPAIVGALYAAWVLVRPELALHPNLPQKDFDAAVEVLVTHPWGEWPKEWAGVACELVRSPRLPASVVNYLLDEPRSWRYLGSNPALPANIRTIIIEQGSPADYLGLIENRAIDPAEFKAWFERAVDLGTGVELNDSNLLNHPCMTGAQLAVFAHYIRIWSPAKFSAHLRSSAACDKSLAAAIRGARSCNITSIVSTLTKFLAKPHGRERAGVQTLEACLGCVKSAGSNDNGLRAAVARHPAVDAGILKRLAKIQNRDVRAAVGAARVRLNQKEPANDSAEAASA